jgi:hypothetical protein
MGANASIPAMARPGAVVIVVSGGAFGGAGGRKSDVGGSAAAPSAPSASRLLRIPEELLHNVLLRVEWGTLVALRSTCRATRAAVDTLGVARLQVRALAGGAAAADLPPMAELLHPAPRRRAADGRTPRSPVPRRSAPVRRGRQRNNPPRTTAQPARRSAKKA